jgi:hypothetical protein
MNFLLNACPSARAPKPNSPVVLLWMLVFTMDECVLLAPWGDIHFFKVVSRFLSPHDGEHLAAGFERRRSTTRL